MNDVPNEENRKKCHFAQLMLSIATLKTLHIHRINRAHNLCKHHLHCARKGERTSSHDSVPYAVNHTIHDSCRQAHLERTSFLSSSVPGERGGRADIVMSHAAAGYTSVGLDVANPTRRDLGERVATQNLVPPTPHSVGRNYAIEIAHLGRNLSLVVETRCIVVGISLLCSWFRQSIVA